MRKGVLIGVVLIDFKVNEKMIVKNNAHVCSDTCQKEIISE